MKLSDPRINEFIEKIRHLIDNGRSPEEIARLGYQMGYCQGFDDGAHANDMMTLMNQAMSKKADDK